MIAKVRVALANFNPIWFVRSVRVLVYLLALWLASPQTVFCAPRAIKPPPVGDTINVQVMRGASTAIILKAFEGRGNPLDYDIVSEPRHGRLEDFREADGNRQGFASVTYVHGDDEDSSEDEFAFRARGLFGGGTSSPIKVKVQIVDAPPRLGITPSVNFSAVAGESDAREIVVANEGGGVLEGRLSPEAPFEVDGDGRFSLGRRQAKTLVVRFSPTSVDAVVPQKLSPAPADPGAAVILRGEAGAPFAAGAEPMVLRPDGSRTASITATNLSSSLVSLDVTIEPAGAANAPVTAEIGKGETVEIPVTIGPDKKGRRFDLLVRISDRFHARDFALEAPAVPPKLHLLTPELDFRANTTASLQVRNSGGVAGHLTLELPPGLQNLERAESIAVAPGETAEVRLRLDRRPKTDEAPSAVMVDLGLGGKVPVPILFAANEQKTAAAAETNSPAPEPPPPPPLRRAWKLNEDVKLQDATDDATIVGWVAAKHGFTDAQLEMVDGQGARPYRPEPAAKSWWGRLADWWSGRAAEAEAALEEKREYFEQRLKVPGEEEPPPSATADKPAEWRKIQLAPEDRQNPEISWRIVARREGGEPEPVSEQFRLNQTANALEAFVEARTKPSPLLPAKRIVPLPAEQPIKVLSWSPMREGATITFEMPSGETVRDYRFERMQRFFGPDPATGHPRITYEGEAFPSGSAEIVGREPSVLGGRSYDVVTVRFSAILPGSEIYWRAVPLADDGAEMAPSGILHFWTLPPWRFPWTSAALAACAIALAAVVFLRWRSRRLVR